MSEKKSKLMLLVGALDEGVDDIRQIPEEDYTTTEEALEIAKDFIEENGYSGAYFYACVPVYKLEKGGVKITDLTED